MSTNVKSMDACELAETPEVHAPATAPALGMWLFLAAETLLFGGLAVAWSVSRNLYGSAFQEAARRLDWRLGALCTFLLLTSGLTMALAGHAARTETKAEREGETNIRLLGLVVATIVFGTLFLLARTGELAFLVPGFYQASAQLTNPGAAVFYGLFFLVTGLHALHVLVALGVLGLAIMGGKPGDRTSLEVGGLLWHWMGLVWVCLFPLLYLVG